MTDERAVEEAWSLARAAEDFPNQAALVIKGRTYSFSQLQRLMFPLLEKIAGSSDPGAIALVAEATLESVLVLYACLETRTPVLLVHPRLPLDSQDALYRRVRPRQIWRGGMAELQSDFLRTPGRKPGSLASRLDQVLVCTSGTSGRPKIVVLSRGALFASFQASSHNIPWKDDDRWLLSLPFAHVGGLSVLTRCLAARKCAVLLPTTPKDEDFCPQLESARVTMLSLVPTQLHALLGQKRSLPPAVRVVLLGGAPLSPTLSAQAHIAKVPILCTYGLTEFASQVCTQSTQLLSENRLTGDCSSGPLLPFLEMRLREDKRICLRGPQGMTRYWDEPQSPWEAEGWFTTSDRGEVAENGSVTILGRTDNIIISGGENISPEEVEAALERLVEVESALVVSVDDPHWGQRVVAFIVVAPTRPKHAPPSDVQEPCTSSIKLAALLKSRLAIHLPAYALPKAFFTLQALPLNQNGKKDRLTGRQLAKKHL